MRAKFASNKRKIEPAKKTGSQNMLPKQKVLQEKSHLCYNNYNYYQGHRLYAKCSASNPVRGHPYSGRSHRFLARKLSTGIASFKASRSAKTQRGERSGIIPVFPKPPLLRHVG